MKRRRPDFVELALWGLAAASLVAAALLVSSPSAQAQIVRKKARVSCEAGKCTLDESDLVGLIGAAEILFEENRRLKAACGERES